MNRSFDTIPAETRTAVIVTMLLGLWVIISPFVLGIPIGGAILWSNVVVGIAVIVTAAIGGWREGAVLGAIVPLAAWLFASTFILNFFSTHFLASNLLSAFALIFESAYSGSLRSTPPSRREM